VSPILFLAVMLFTVAALVCDVRTRRIPNGLNVTGLILALGVHSAVRGWDGFVFSLAGFGTGFGILFVLWIIGGGGGGDVKLMGAVGAWLGPTLTLIVFIASGFLSAVGQLGLNVWRTRKSSAATDSMESAETTVSDEKKQINENNRRSLPYAVPVAIAVWAVCGLKLVKIFATG
jgi:prepilin peptidase CpaA